MTPLFLAIELGNAEMVNFLLENGLKLDDKSAGGETPMHHAAKCDNLDAISLLHAKGANVASEALETQQIPIMNASEKGNIGAVKLLIKLGGNINEPDSTGLTPIEFAARGGDIQVVNAVARRAHLKLDKTLNFTEALKQAAMGGHIDVFDLRKCCM
jgi:ankyrin repeat protein